MNLVDLIFRETGCLRLSAVIDRVRRRLARALYIDDMAVLGLDLINILRKPLDDDFYWGKTPSNFPPECVVLTVDVCTKNGSKSCRKVRRERKGYLTGNILGGNIVWFIKGHCAENLRSAWWSLF